MHATSFRVWQNLYTKTQKKHSAQILNLLDNVHLYREKLALLGQHTSFAKIFFHLQSRSIHWQIHRMSKVLSFSNSSSPATRMWRTQKFSQCLSSRGHACLFRQALLKSVWVCVYMSVLFCSQVLQLKVACGLGNPPSVYVRWVCFSLCGTIWVLSNNCWSRSWYSCHSHARIFQKKQSEVV